LPAAGQVKFPVCKPCRAALLSITLIFSGHRAPSPRLRRQGYEVYHPLVPNVQTGPSWYTVCTGSLSGVKVAGRGVYDPPHLALRLKKEYSNTSIFLWIFVALSMVNFTNYLYIYLRNCVFQIINGSWNKIDIYRLDDLLSDLDRI
jgi:hypothetical protein